MDDAKKDPNLDDGFEEDSSTFKDSDRTNRVSGLDAKETDEYSDFWRTSAPSGDGVAEETQLNRDDYSDFDEDFDEGLDQDLVQASGRSSILDRYSDMYDFDEDVEIVADKETDDLTTTDEFFGVKQARAASGNYLLTVGYPRSGKSTFHAMLFRFIEDSGRFSYGLRAPAGQTEPSLIMQQRMNDWRSRWKRRNFVPATAARERDIYEISYGVTPLTGVKSRLDFSVIEVSGELLKSIGSAYGAGDISLPAALHELLKNKAVKPVLVMMVDPEEPENEVLFKSLLDYIRKYFPDRMRSLAVCALISKPRLAMELLASTPEGRKYRHEPKYDAESRTLFLKLFAPGMFSHLKGMDKNQRLVSWYSVGQLDKRVDKKTGQEVDFMAKVDDTHTKLVFSWIYTQFTGRNLGKTRFQKAWDDLTASPKRG